MNNNIIIKVLPTASEVIAIPRINIMDEFYKEYSNAVHLHEVWMHSLSNHYPNWMLYNIKKVKESMFLLYPEYLATSNAMYFEPLKGHPAYYGYVINVKDTFESSVTSVLYNAMCDAFLKIGQRTYTVDELQRYSVAGHHE